MCHPPVHRSKKKPGRDRVKVARAGLRHRHLVIFLRKTIILDFGRESSIFLKMFRFYFFLNWFSFEKVLPFKVVVFQCDPIRRPIEKVRKGNI